MMSLTSPEQQYLGGGTGNGAEVTGGSGLVGSDAGVGRPPSRDSGYGPSSSSSHSLSPAHSNHTPAAGEQLATPTHGHAHTYSGGNCTHCPGL